MDNKAKLKRNDLISLALNADFNHHAFHFD